MEGHVASWGGQYVGAVRGGWVSRCDCFLNLERTWNGDIQTRHSVELLVDTGKQLEGKQAQFPSYHDNHTPLLEDAVVANACSTSLSGPGRNII